MIVVKVTSTENKIIIKKGDDAIAKQFALASQASAIAAGESEKNAGASEQVANEKAAQALEDAASALASKQEAESAATASGGFATNSGISASASNAANELSEAAKVIAIQEAEKSSTSAGQSAASAAAAEAAKNLSVSAKDTAIEKASEANSSSITATTQAGISTDKAVESAQSAAQSLASKNEADAILANTLTGGAVAGQVSFWNGPKNLIGDSSFVWDNVNKRLGISYTNTAKLNIAHINSSTGLAASGAQFAIRFKNEDNTDNNLSLIVSDSSSGQIDSSIFFRHTNHLLNYGEIGFATRGASGFTEKWKVSETGILQSLGAQTIQTTGSNLLTLQASGGQLRHAGNIPNAVGNIANYSASGFLQQRTPLQHINDILKALPTYNPAIFQTLTHNASGVIAWT
jgi:hypothetical protein